MSIQGPRPIRDCKYHWEEPLKSPPIWEGEGSRILGIHGQAVEQDQYLNLTQGYFRDMKLQHYSHPDRRAAFEITFTLPKSVSLMKELAGDERIVSVMEKARVIAMAEIEHEAQTRCPWQKTDNLIHTTFYHSTSRMHDPHYHAHTAIMNLSHTGERWKAIELRYIDMEQVAATYRDSCMKGLRQCGYKLERAGAEYEIVGVPAEIKARFSRRNQAITQIGAEFEELKGSPLSAKAKNKLSVIRKPEKTVLSDPLQHWHERMTDDERSNLNRIASQARHVVRWHRWREESRSAFERNIPEVEHTQEQSRGRGHSR